MCYLPFRTIIQSCSINRKQRLQLSIQPCLPVKMSKEEASLSEQIKDLVPINKLPPNLQARLLDQARVMDVNKSRFLFKQGDKDNYSYFLLEGEIELLAGNQGGDIIKGGSDRARYALARIQPRQFSAQARTRLKVLIIERNSLDQLLMLADQSGFGEQPAGADDMGVDSIDAVRDDSDWMTHMLQSGLFSRMPMANIQQLFTRLEPIEYQAGAVVIRQGDPGDYYYIISEGRCAVSRKPSAKSNDVKIAELGIGDSFGEEALVSNSKRNATITMQSDGVVMRLAKDDFMELIKKPTLQALTYKQAAALIEQGGQWLDVRFPDEHQDSAIAGSVNIPLNSLRLESAKLDEARRYVLYCDTTERSSAGAFLLAERGFEVGYLEGGLLNNPEALGAKVAVRQPAAARAGVETPPPRAEEAEAEVDAGVQVEMLNAELETTQMRIRVAREQAVKDIDQKKELEALQKKLGEERKKLERQKKEAEAEASKKAKEEEQRLKELVAGAEKKMRQEKRQLEDIYNKNAREMERLQKARQSAKEKTQKEKEKLEQQAAAVTKQIAEAQRLRREIEASKKSLEQEAEQKRRENERHEKDLQEKAKAKLEQERRKLTEQYARNVEEFEALKKEKAAVEASRLAAREEAQKIIREYKLLHDKTRAEEEAKIKAERRKLEQEAKKIQQTMTQIRKIKLEAELAKQEAQAEARRLREKQMDETRSRAQRERLATEIKAAREKVAEAQKEIENALQREKQTASARQENEADLSRKKQEQEALLSRIKTDLADFEDKQQEEAATITKILIQADHMRRIKHKAEEAKRKSASASASMLEDISRQLPPED